MIDYRVKLLEDVLANIDEINSFLRDFETLKVTRFNSENDSFKFTKRARRCIRKFNNHKNSGFNIAMGINEDNDNELISEITINFYNDDTIMSYSYALASEKGYIYSTANIEREVEESLRLLKGGF